MNRDPSCLIYQTALSIHLSSSKLILNESHPNKNVSVPDPYYGRDSGFENVYIMLDKACNVIANKLNL